MKKKFNKIDTKLIKSGEPEPLILGAVSMPIFQSSTFEYSGQASYHDLKYIRLNNTPNHTAVHEKLADLENAQAALVTSSGMAAISATLLAFLSSGDHFLAQDCLYGGTYDLITKDLTGLGMTHDFIDGSNPEDWETKLKPETKLIYVESITNPLMQVADLEQVVEFARKHTLLTIIDNTFPSPFNFRPMEWGFDISVHSCTKYLNGHSDIVAGAVIGSKEHIRRVTNKLNHFGGSLDPHAVFLLHRGIKTLAVRMRQHNENAMKIAQYLQSRHEIEKVHFPGLHDHPDHTRAKRFFDGFSGMLSFELKGDVHQADNFIKHTEIPISAPSLGGIETLITRPVTTSHAGISKADRDRMGISESLIRLSVGIESADDIIEDFSCALDSL
jgi:cystathionine beta-lyase/cystathionine gamma-synthase